VGCKCLFVHVFSRVKEKLEKQKKYVSIECPQSYLLVIFAFLRYENTLATFQRAVDLGCDMLELDVQLTQVGFITSILQRQRLPATHNGFFPTENILNFEPKMLIRYRLERA
jgi:hypothetical protein